MDQTSVVRVLRQRSPIDSIVTKDDLDLKITLFKEKRADFLARFPDVVGDSDSDSSDNRATQKKKRQPEEGAERSKKSRPNEEPAGDGTDEP